jgi:2-C-methyl-D-erythritol 4-phosphate cytidylyltransferase
MQEHCAAVIVAAGSSQRMEGWDKLWIPLAGRITLARTIDVFEASPLIQQIVLVVKKERLAEARGLCQQESWRKVVALVAGGDTRQASVWAGLETLAECSRTPDWVMIHDGARPLITQHILAHGLEAAQQQQAAVAAIAVKDTIKQIREGYVSTTIERAELRAIQTPQVFAFPLIYQLHASAARHEEKDATDDAALLERAGYQVATFPGSYTNIKITTPEDVLIAEALLQGSFICVPAPTPGLLTSGREMR